MPYQNIDAAISTKDMQTVKDAFALILKTLPFLVNLTADERKSMFKAGPNSLSFVTRAASAAQANSQIFPASFDIQGFQQDVDLFVAMTELFAIAQSATSQIDDTRLAVGGEAMQGAGLVYQYVKTAAKNTPGLKPIAEDLGERFKRASKKDSGKPKTGSGT